MKILLVDDEKLIREYVKDILDLENHDVTTANSYDEAVKCLEANTFDLVITDIIMSPGKDGTQLCAFIKDTYPKTPVIAMTAGIENATQDYVNMASFFADVSLAKPVKGKELLKIVNELVNA